MNRLVRPALGATVLLALAAAPALASHSHVKLLGNGQCVPGDTGIYAVYGFPAGNDPCAAGYVND